MIIHVLFGQKVEEHEFQNAPEALAVIDDVTAKVKPDYMAKTRSEVLDSEYYSGAEWVKVDMGSVDLLIRNTIAPPPLELTGTLAQPKGKDIRNASITVQVGRKGGRIDDSEIL